MSRLREARLGVVFALALAGITTSATTAHAEPPPRVLLQLDERVGAEVDGESLRAAVQRELPRQVEVRVAASPGQRPKPEPAPEDGGAGAGARLIVTRLPNAGKNARLQVRYEGPAGKVIERTIDVPDEPAKTRETIALLLANWVQDDTDELAKSLRPPAPATSAASASASTSPPSATPAEDGSAGPEPAAPLGERSSPPPPASAPEERSAALDGACGTGERKGIVDYPALFEVVPLGHGDAVAGPRAARAPEARVAFALGLVGSHPGLVRGAAVSVIGSYGRSSVCGLDMAGLGVHVGGPVVGAQVAGLVGIARDLRGAQLAPVTFVERRLEGVQSGVLAIAGSVRGGQISSANFAASVRGAQIGAFNLAFDRADVQLAAFNWTRDNVLQVGAANFARDSEAQVGAVNVAKRASFQLGAVNIAERADVTIGALSIVRHGRAHLDVVGYDYRAAAVELVHGGTYTHGIYGAGGRVTTDREVLPDFYVGIGGHIPLTSATRGFARGLDIDVLTHFLPGPRFRRNTQLHQLRVVADLPLTAGVAVLVGPTLNVSLSDTADHVRSASALGDSFVDEGTTTTVRLWPGLTAGLRFF